MWGVTSIECDTLLLLLDGAITGTRARHKEIQTGNMNAYAGDCALDLVQRLGLNCWRWNGLVEKGMDAGVQVTDRPQQTR